MKHALALLCLFIHCLLAACVALRAAPAGAQPPGRFTVTPLETRVLGQNTWLRGGPAALRVIVLDHRTGRPVPAQVRLTLAGPKGSPYALWAGRTDAAGTVDASFAAPKVKSGAYTLRVQVDSALGEDVVTQPLTLAESVRTLLSSDKPVYQPGQTIHLRALALDTATRSPLAGQPLTFEVEDARGNKVFKQRALLSRYGIASADFDLADEVNQGDFTLRAVLASGQAEKTVRVERYVLPKFKVAVTTDKPYYLPGETVHGTLDAHYFFGKPVADASVTVTVSTLDIGVSKLGEMSGKTDAGGKYTFDYTLPTSFVGQPFAQGKAVVELAASVKDTADQTQGARASLPVVKEPIVIAIVPEHRGVVPGVENRVFIAAATPDGQPITGLYLFVHERATMTGASDFYQPTELVTDSLGLATFSFVPHFHDSTVVVEAQKTAVPFMFPQTTAHLDLEAAAPEESLILRADKPLARVGDTLTLAAVSSVKGGTLYLDVIRNGQTILTRATDMPGGSASLTLPVTDDMTGTLALHAYKILPNEDIIRDTRTVIVSPADDLTVRVAADKPEYKPGGDATLRFSVTDPSGAPVQAALGLAMVDESVFALSELQPGLEKVYFTLEKELMEPRYEIHGLTPSSLLLEGRADAPRQRAATLLLASAPAPDGFDWRVNTYQVKLAKARAAARVEMGKAAAQIIAALEKYREREKTLLTAQKSLTFLVSLGDLKQAALIDPWGHWYNVNLRGSRDYGGYFTLNSAGPDGVWGTDDDTLDVPVYADGGFPGGAGGFPGGGFPGGGGGQFGGGGFGGGRFGGMAVPAPRTMAAAPVRVAGTATMPNGVARIFALQNNNSLTVQPTAGPAAPRVRSYFPETMYWNPSLLTDDAGHAAVRLPMADSITTWRLSMFAGGLAGQMGSATAPVRVFQDFFVDLDLPVALTQHDSVEIPVTVYNYLPSAQGVTLTLAPQPWFTLRGPPVQTLSVGPGEVKVVYYPITVTQLGHFDFLVTAHGTTLSDAVRRTVDVLPDGKRHDTALNGRLDGPVERTVTLPAGTVPGASKLFVKLYPGAFSQLVEGLDGMLQMPSAASSRRVQPLIPMCWPWTT